MVRAGHRSRVTVLQSSPEGRQKMSSEVLQELKERAASLTPEEMCDLEAFLREQVRAKSKTPPIDDDAERHRKQTEWLKAHREEYAGRYVALVGDKLVGVGATIREAHEQAKANGIAEPLLAFVSSEKDVPFGGW